MKRLNAKGFTLIHILLLVVILGMISGVGYYVYSSQKNTNTTLDNAAKSQVDPNKNEISLKCAKELELSAGCDKLNNPQTKTTGTVKKVIWKDVSEDLKAAIKDTWDTRATGWDDPNNTVCLITPNKGDYSIYVDTDAALGGVGCDGGAATLWVKVDSNWKYIQSTQMGFTCINIDKYHVSKELISASMAGLEAKCYNYEAQTERSL